ncbi:BgTH12-07053 [Blumeria graminis f. sp. triticale]|uniref:BgTH12-07053 n=1 Tax=Blumeria graminis f. sp. triticale TaxID=1689686 RepID=A0A9W4GIP8_BLUGR|nr:BgTH12-07053 [Blumeria graminis f. sp. triticale]
MWELQAQRPPTYPSNHPNQDLDDPGPSQTPYDYSITLEYDELPDEPTDDLFDAPNPSDSFRMALGRNVAAAEIRAKEAESLFGSIVSKLDNHWAAPSHNSLPVYQRLALKNFCKDLAEVVTHHFDAYTSGKLVQKLNQFLSLVELRKCRRLYYTPRWLADPGVSTPKIYIVVEIQHVLA